MYDGNQKREREGGREGGNRLVSRPLRPSGSSSKTFSGLLMGNRGSCMEDPLVDDAADGKK